MARQRRGLRLRPHTLETARVVARDAGMSLAAWTRRVLDNAQAAGWVEYEEVGCKSGRYVMVYADDLKRWTVWAHKNRKSAQGWASGVIARKLRDMDAASVETLPRLRATCPKGSRAARRQHEANRKRWTGWAAQPFDAGRQSAHLLW